MVDTPRQPAPQPASVTKTATVSKEVTLPHMPAKPREEYAEGSNIPLPDNTLAEQAAGRAAVDTNEDQLSAEQEAGRAAIARFNKR